MYGESSDAHNSANQSPLVIVSFYLLHNAGKANRSFPSSRELELNTMKQKQVLNNRRRAFLLTFFEKDEYTEKEINGFWLVKHWDGRLNEWCVAIYTEESLQRLHAGHDKLADMQQNQIHWDSLRPVDNQS